MSARSKTAAPSGQQRALWKALIGALVGAIVVCVVTMTIAYGGLNFHARPRISAITLLVGIVGLMYALERLGATIELLGKLWSVRAQQAAAADRAKRRSG